jgi:hypothetical protein
VTDLAKVYSGLQQVNRRKEEGWMEGRKEGRKAEIKEDVRASVGSRNFEGSTGIFLPAVQQYNQTSGPPMHTMIKNVICHASVS